jgi:hypothetical protein
MAKEFVAINLGNHNSYTPNTRFFCSLCNRSLSTLDETKNEYVCTTCNVSYFPNKENVKRKSVFSTPGPLTNERGDIIGDKTPIVSMVDDNKRELSSSYKQPKLSPFFKEMLSRPGVNLIDYQTSED